MPPNFQIKRDGDYIDIFDGGADHCETLKIQLHDDGTPKPARIDIRTSHVSTVTARDLNDPNGYPNYF